MGNSTQVSRALITRIFIAQIALIGATTALVAVALVVDVGFFWFAFISGVFGASIRLLRRVDSGGLESAWMTVLMPLLYGGMLAAVAYFLFFSRILSGVEGGGLIATNLFPDFQSFATEPADRLRISDWLDMRPASLVDAGKLVIWCFLAGYSEHLITGVLERLEQSTRTS